jgi:hypothetical protein
MSIGVVGEVIYSASVGPWVKTAIPTDMALAQISRSVDGAAVKTFVAMYDGYVSCVSASMDEIAIAGSARCVFNLNGQPWNPSLWVEIVAGSDSYNKQLGSNEFPFFAGDKITCKLKSSVDWLNINATISCDVEIVYNG